MQQHKASTKLSICIVGGGIGGLAVSILLAKSGHNVVVFERRDADYEGRSTGGIALTYNSTRIFEQMSLKDELEGIADQGYPMRMKYDTLEVMFVAKGARPYFMVHRADVTNILAERALEVGVTIHYKAKIASILDEQNQVTVRLKDDKMFTSDILIGADGIDSLVRHTIFPEIFPHVTPCTVMLLNIPKSTMDADPGTRDLYNIPPLHTPWGPGLSIVSWTMTNRRIYHLQLSDYEYGTGEPYSFHDPPDAPYITTLDDAKSLEALRKRWAMFDPRIQRICNSATSYTKWKIAELPPLPRYSSSSGRVILLGDAAHAIKPFAGQGANMCIEDSRALSTLLSLITSKDEISDAVSLYDELRVSRLARIRSIIESNVRLFGMKDSEEEKKSDEKAKDELRKAQEERLAAQAVNYRWILEYDTEAEARKAWSNFQSGKALKARI